MATVREQLMWKALCAVDEATEEAGRAPVRPSFALRFALAYLFTCSTGERWLYDAFWRDIQMPSPIDGRSCHRGMMARSGLEGIMRSVGVTPTFESIKALTERRLRMSPEAAAQRRLARALRDEGEAQKQRVADKERARDCGWL